MANEVRFNIRLNIDGKDKVVTATTAMSNLRQVVGSVNEAADNLKSQLINTNQITEAWNSVTGAFQQMLSVVNQVTSESRSFGAAMASANTMAGKSGEELAAMKRQVTELAKVIPIARDELANGLYQVISNGVPEDNWIEYLRSSAEASVGGIADLGEVVKVTSTIIKNYGLEWSNAGEIQDKIQLTAKNGVTSFEQMAQALPRVTAQASTLGVTIDELMASFATLTGVSGNTAEVSTQLAAIFTALIKPSSEAVGMAQQMGIQFDAAAIKAAGGMQQFLVSLDKNVKRFAATSGMLEQEIYGRLFGSAESLRALTPLVGNLASKFEENTAQMQDSAGTVSEAFGIMGNTGSAVLQKLNNQLGEYTDLIQDSIGNALPYINMGSQLIVTANQAASLWRAIRALGIVSKASSAAVAAFGPICQVASAAFTGATVSANTLRLAIRGLMITTGVGVAIVALTEVINRLTTSSDKAAQGTDNLKLAEQRAQQAHEQTAQQIASVRSEMALNISKLKEFKGSKEQEKTLVQQMNAKYGEALGYYSTVSQWYQALTANSKAYCDQMINEIRLRQLASQAADLQKQQHDIKYNADGTLRKYSNQNKTTTKVTGQVDAGDGKIIPIKQEVEVKGTSQLANANKQLTSLHRQEQNIHKEMEKIFATSGKLKVTKVDGWSTTAPTLGAPSKTGGKTTPKVSTPKAAKEPDPLKGSIDWYEKAIDEKRKQLEATANAATRKQLQNEIEGLQRTLGMMKVEAGIEVTPRIEVKKSEQSIIQKVDEELKDFLDKFQPIEIPVEVKDIDRIKELGNINFSNLDSVKSMLENIKQITDPAAQSMAIAGTSCEALGSAMQQLGADSAAAKAGMMMAAIGQLVLSFAQALTDSSKNWVTWLAFGITGSAQLASLIGMVSRFATGGIVGGNQKSGDNVLVRVNSGEMILNAAQQSRLFALANGASVQVQSQRLQGLMADRQEGRHLDLNLKLRGRDLVAAIANETRTNSRRSNIR